MRLIRLKADYTENKNEYIILNLIVDQDDKILTDYEMFGYLVDDEEDVLHTYPFIIHATNKSDFMTFKYGADSEYAMDKVNLPQREVRIGEYFTRWVNNIDEYTYIIRNIEKII